MSKRTTTLVWYSAIPLWLLISFARKHPEFIEKYYSRLFYPFFFDLHQLFFDLRDKFNQTFVIVTHNEDLAKMSDRCLNMQDGKIV